MEENGQEQLLRKEMKGIGVLWTTGGKMKRCKVPTTLTAEIYEYGRVSVMEFPCFLRHFMVAIFPII
jgi:hypothetical protein